MSLRSLPVVLSITFVVAVGLADRARAQCPDCPAGKGTTPPGAGLGWSYYGLGNGGPYITYPPEASAKSHKQSVAVYAPIAPAEPVGTGKLWNPPRHRLFGYGWLGYRGPSVRPKPETVNVIPGP
jgi:hypothetical protein